MDLATGAMGNLLLKLGKLLKEEYKLQTGVKENVQYLERELKTMHASLRKVGDVPRDQLDELVKLWVDDVRDLSYKMEDIVDTFLVSIEGPEPTAKPPKLKQLMKKMSDLFTKGKTRHGIGDDINDIKVRVQEAADRRDRYKVNDVVVNPTGATMIDPRLLALYKDKKELVGIDGALTEITKMLTDGEGDAFKQLKILSIFGFGGLGKTTLAKAVYDKLQAPFDCSAFVPIGRNPSMKKLLNDILFGINKQMQLGLDERQLIDELRRLLKNKRFFIVIDDIWDTEIWKIIMCAFTHNNSASRIITTTCILEVATQSGEVYRLEPLSHDLSRELFNTRLFGGKSNNSYDEPMEAYDKILHKCGGVPLAITTIASLLVGKPVEFWSKIYDSIGFGDQDNKDVDTTRKILLFSYYDLPCHLQTCLLYLSIYPEDHMIKKDSLIWKWIAEGFVHEEPWVGLYEIGEKYFNELVNKSMIQPIEHHANKGIIIGCRVHDMVLDMICMLGKEENFVTVLNSN
uniref:Disease resistance protein RPP13 n=1 Tax=Triticum urartu TaxID=4572 RepID=A0A8R7QWI3_TRIUA